VNIRIGLDWVNWVSKTEPSSTVASNSMTGYDEDCTQPPPLERTAGTRHVVAFATLNAI